MTTVADGIRTGLHECRKRFKYQRWNCSLNAEHRTFFGPTFKIGRYLITFLEIISKSYSNLHMYHARLLYFPFHFRDNNAEQTMISLEH